MLLTAVLVSTLLFGLGSCGVIQETLTHFNLGTGDVAHVKSVNYPNDTAANQRQTWIIKTVADSVIELSCGDIRLFKSEPCGDYALEIKDNGEKLVKCGLHFNFKYTSNGDSLEITLRTGEWARGFVSCDARPVAAIEGGETTTEESLFSYIEEPFREIDSSEHGVTKGPRGTTCNCGWANKRNQRIFYGKETKVNEYPFMVGIVKKRNPPSVFCGAGIITAHHALTAAHCVNNRTTGIGILVGEHDLQSASETSATELINVRQVITHPEYSGYPNYLNDIAIIVLERQIAFNTFVAPVCVPNGPIQLTNQYVTAMGWGATENEYQKATSLKYIHVRVLSKPACHAIRQPWVPAGSPNQLCVYGTRRSSCFGDSGGPVVWVDPETNRYTVIGIISYGVKECATQTPSVITDVSTYLDWIHRAIRETNPNGVTCTKAS